jgi:hypothetical protein
VREHHLVHRSLAPQLLQDRIRVLHEVGGDPLEHGGALNIHGRQLLRIAGSPFVSVLPLTSQEPCRDAD